MSDTKLADLTAAGFGLAGGTPTCEDLLYLVKKYVLTDSTAGSSRSVTVNELGAALLNALGCAQSVDPGGRLTLTTALPITTADVASTSTLYYTPFRHSYMPMYNSSLGGWRLYRFQELSLTLSGLTSGKNYDVYATYSGAPTYRANSSGTLNASSTVTLPTRSSGDRLVVLLTCTGTSAPAAGTGWTRLGTVTVSTTQTSAAYTKISDGTDSTGPLATTCTGAYGCISIQNGTGSVALWQSPLNNTSVTVLSGSLDNFLNPECVYFGGWGINSNSITITPDTANAFAAALTTLGTQTFPSGTGRQLVGYRNLPSNDFRLTSNQALFSSAVNALAFGVVVSGSPTLSLGTAWTNDTTRATALDWTTGRFNIPATSGIYLGTIRADGTTTTIDTKLKRFVWNMYNRVRRYLTVAGASSHVYGTASYRSWNNDNTLRVEFIQGLAGDPISCAPQAQLNQAAIVALGIDSTTANGLSTFIYNGNTNSIAASYVEDIAGLLGYHYAQLIEFGNGASATFEGARANVSVMG